AAGQADLAGAEVEGEQGGGHRVWRPSRCEGDPSPTLPLAGEGVILPGLGSAPPPLPRGGLGRGAAAGGAIVSPPFTQLCPAWVDSRRRSIPICLAAACQRSAKGTS